MTWFDPVWTLDAKTDSDQLLESGTNCTLSMQHIHGSQLSVYVQLKGAMFYAFCVACIMHTLIHQGMLSC